MATVGRHRSSAVIGVPRNEPGALCVFRDKKYETFGMIVSADGDRVTVLWIHPPDEELVISTQEVKASGWGGWR